MTEEQKQEPAEPAAEAKHSATSAAAPNAPPSSEHFAHTAQTFSTFVFNGPVRAGNVGSAGATRSARRRVTGRLDGTDVEAALSGYVPPPGYDEALAALLADHVVILQGETGCGRAAGAIALLREVTDRPLVVLPPVITRKQLARRSYDPAFAYLVFDHADEGPAADVDHTWRTVRDRVRDEGETYLVVTAAADTVADWVEAVLQVRWQRPPLLAVLRAHLAESPLTDEAIDQLAEGIPDRWGMTSVARLAGRIAKGEDQAGALEELEVDASRRVQEWFEKKGRLRRDILGVAALAFVAGATERSFESARARLEAAVAKHMPLRKQKGAKESHPDLPSFRTALVAPDGLIAVQLVTSGPVTKRTLGFKMPAYRRYVLGELWARYEAPFWDALREWLNEIISEYDPVEIARGLCLLADVNLDEVTDLFLEPWARDEGGIPGMLTATYLLWWMCYDEALASAALQTTVRWTNQGSSAQRWTAALAFSGELGVRYPTDVTRRLWQLVTSGDEVSGPAQEGLARLFVTLVEEDQDASVILTMLDRHMVRFGRRGADDRLMMLTMTSVLEILGARDERHHRPAIFVLLHEHPERADLVARLLAGTLCHRRYRRDALQALWEGLRALEQISATPTEDAALLGNALAEALPAEEHAALHSHLAVTDRRAHRRDTKANVDALLEALGEVRTEPSDEAKESS